MGSAIERDEVARLRRAARTSLGHGSTWTARQYDERADRLEAVLDEGNARGRQRALDCSGGTGPSHQGNIDKEHRYSAAHVANMREALNAALDAASAADAKGDYRSSARAYGEARDILTGGFVTDVGLLMRSAEDLK